MRLLFTLILLFITTAPTFSQESGRVETTIQMRRSSGILVNNSKTRATLYKEAITVDNAASIRLQFGRTTLGNPPIGGQPTILRITSYQDGAVQHLTSKTLEEWRYTSAWFNGSMVLVEIIADPHASPSHVALNHVLIETLPRSICGPHDDRVLSDDPKAGRVYPIGCTAWLIDDPNHCLLSAGHCTDSMDMMEFNVPLSNSNGSWQHPGPEDQYMIDPASLQFVDNTIGDDWAYFGCFPNTETGLTAAEAQGEWYTLAESAPAVDGQTIRITGYGTTSPPVDSTWNSAQKTHSGPYTSLAGNSIAYTVDTTGGNSGSAVLNETTGEAIGIHTNGGCGSYGENYGCAIHNSGLQYALANPQGVCIPNNYLEFGYPNGLPTSVTPNTITPFLFTITDGTESPLPETIQFRIIIDGSPQNLEVISFGNNTYQVMLPSMECNSEVGFYISITTDQGTFVSEPYDAPNNLYEIIVGTLEETSLITAHFDNGMPLGWSATGLWHASSSCTPTGSCDGGSFMYFGQDSSCTYDTGSTTQGTLISPTISINDVQEELVLTFCYALETEEYDGYDTAKVYANGELVGTLEESPQWTEYEITLPNAIYHQLTITWVFDSVDSQFNSYRGLHIDGVLLIAHEIACEAPPCIGDINQDNNVDISDLLLLIDAWGSSGIGDFDNNGVIDVTDMLMLIGAWGVCE